MVIRHKPTSIFGKYCSNNSYNDLFSLESFLAVLLSLRKNYQFKYDKTITNVGIQSIPEPKLMLTAPNLLLFKTIPFIYYTSKLYSTNILAKQTNKRDIPVCIRKLVKFVVFKFDKIIQHDMILSLEIWEYQKMILQNDPARCFVPLVMSWPISKSIQSE